MLAAQKIFNRLLNSAGIPLLFLLTGCSLTQVVPIQVGRISQTETFEQKFSFVSDYEKILSADKKEEAQEKTLHKQTKEIDDVFSLMLGEANWQIIKDLYGIGNLRKELMQMDITIQGLTQMNIYPDPFDERYFSIDGTGRYFLIRKNNGAILLTGDYSIRDQHLSVADLDKGYVILAMDLFLIKIPGQVTFNHESRIKYKIFIDNSLGDQGIYRIDYNAQHLAFLVRDGEKLSAHRPFATIEFKAPQRPTKLWDFRGIQFMRRDYQTLLQ